MTPAGEPDNPSHPWQRRLVYAWLGVLLLAFVVTAIANRDTGRSLSHVSGAWVAISHWATQGLYYPPLESDGNYAGTRFGPLALALHAGAHLLFDDPLIGPKLLHLVYMLALMAGLWVALKPMQLPGHVRLFLALTPIATWIGWTAGMTIRHDALAAALQVWAIAVVYRKDGPTAGRVALAAVLAGLAVLAKVSGMWGAAACLFYLAFVAPRRLLVLVPVGLGTVGLGLLFAELASDGRFSQNMRACLFPNIGRSELTGLAFLIDTARRFASVVISEPLIVVMLLLSIPGACLALRSLKHLSLSCLFVWLMSAYLMSNPGIDGNHLIDLVAVSCLGAGVWLGVHYNGGDHPLVFHDPPRPRTTRKYDYALYVLLGLSLCAVFLPATHFSPWMKRPMHVAEAVGDLTGIAPTNSAEQWVRSQLDPGEQVVSFNPMVPVLLGEDPIVADAWMIRVIFKNDPEQQAVFLQRIQDREFDAFVFGIDVGPQLDFSPQHFGVPVLAAVREHYELQEPVTAYSVFRPKGSGGER